MSDLLERLRDKSVTDIRSLAELSEEAADEIERVRNAYAAALASGREERAELARLRSLNAELMEALEKTKGALLSDPPNGPQKRISGDGVVYHLDGQSVNHALNLVRATLSRARAKEDT